MVTLRVYQPQRDEEQAYALWQRTLGAQWPLTREIFHSITVANEAYRDGDHLVALAGQEIVGFAGYQIMQLQQLPPYAGLLLIMVTPNCQRQGIGRTLHDAVLATLARQGVSEVQLGSGALSYFWAGVPTNLVDAWPFFQACGWQEIERTFDLVGVLKDCSTPAWVYERIQRVNVTVDVATQEDIPAILAFEAQHFPKWLPSYWQVIEHGCYADVVVAKDEQGSIVGTSFVRDPHAVWYPHDIPWTVQLGENTGGVGPLGVAEDMRGRGVGLALAARVTELLQERGIATRYIGYTWLVDWYGHLGYRLWCEHRVSRRTL